MSLIRFARMCEALELQDSTKNKIKIIDESLSSFSNPRIVIDILSLNLEVNSIGNKRAITWVANALELFDSEVKAEEEIWGDIGDFDSHWIVDHTKHGSKREMEKLIK